MELANTLLAFLLTPTTVLFYITISSIYFWSTIDNDSNSPKARKIKQWFLVVGVAYLIFCFVLPTLFKLI